MSQNEVTLAELAKILGLILPRVKQLASEGVVTMTRPGHADLADSVQRYLGSIRERKDDRGLAEAAQQLKSENDRTEARLVPTNSVITFIESVFEMGCGALSDMEATMSDLPIDDRIKLAAGVAIVRSNLEARKNEAIRRLRAHPSQSSED